MKQQNRDTQQTNRILGHVVGQQFSADELSQIAGGFEAKCGKVNTPVPCAEGWPQPCMGCEAD